MVEEKEPECGGEACRTCEFEDDCGFHYRNIDYPDTCPRCDHGATTPSIGGIDRGNLAIDMKCDKCAFTWSEAYSFEAWHRTDR